MQRANWQCEAPYSTSLASYCLLDLSTPADYVDTRSNNIVSFDTRTTLSGHTSRFHQSARSTSASTSCIAARQLAIGQEESVKNTVTGCATPQRLLKASDNINHRDSKMHARLASSSPLLAAERLMAIAVPHINRSAMEMSHGGLNWHPRCP